MRELFDAEVVQFMRPHGRQEHTSTRLPLESKPAYLDMLAHKCRLEAEVLTTGLVSVTISDGTTDIDIRVVANGPKVQQALVDMLEGGRWKTSTLCE